MFIDVAPYTDPLSRTPSVLRAVIEGRPDAWLDSRHAPDVVSPRETIAHLLSCEAEESWIDRLRNLLEPGRGFTPGPYANMRDREIATVYPVQRLLDEFGTYRARSLEQLMTLGLTPDDLERSTTNPDFGTQTVGNLLATWVAHDLYHLGQIFKSYSSLYADEIGPYQRYLNLPHFN